MGTEEDMAESRAGSLISVNIKVNNSVISARLRVSNIYIQKEINSIPGARLEFIINPDDQKAEITIDETFKHGNEIEIQAGYKTELHPLFKGIIVKQSLKIRNSNSILSVECQDKSVRMTIGRKYAGFESQIKDSDVAENIISSYGIGADIESTEVTHERLTQFDSTDWDFIVNRSDVNGRICIADDGRIIIKKPDLNSKPVLRLEYGSNIIELDAEIDARLQFKNVKAVSWDNENQEILQVAIQNPGIFMNGNADPSVLADVVGLKEYILKHGGEVEKSELQAWGSAWWSKRQLSKINGRIRFQGIHSVKPGNLIELKGAGKKFDGNCFVSSVQHFIKAGDWQTEIQIGINPNWFLSGSDDQSIPASGLLSAVGGLQIGKVTQLENDPENMNRIRVRIPIIDNQDQGIWARLSTLDAGNMRGTFFLPEIGDEVIVGFINDDPRDAVVLGMMNSLNKPAPLTATDSNHKKGIVTRSGMQIIFDDSQKSIRLETPAGNKILLDEAGKMLKMEDQNGNKIMMSADGILIESSKAVQLKSPGNIKLDAADVQVKAGATLNVESAATAEIKAGATLNIKGIIVNIN